MKKRILPALTLIAALFVTACGSGSKGGQTAPTDTKGGGQHAAAGTPRKGGVFRAAMNTNPPTLDVASTILSTARQSAFYFQESLVTYDDSYTIIPQLAEKWDVSTDGKVYTFPLRKGVKFHNGKEMKAEDVLASYERFLSVSPRKGEFAVVDKAVAKDEYTVEFHLKAASGGFLPALASPIGFMPIMPKEVITGKGVGQLQVKDLIGTGPYQLIEWIPDKGLKLKRFEDYKPAPGDLNGLGGGRIAYYDEIDLIPVPEAGARVAGLESGEYDFAEGLPYTEYDRLKENKKIQTFIHKPESWIVLEFNHADKKLSGNLKFRQAVQAAVDIDAIMTTVTVGRPEFYRNQPSLFFNEQSWWNEAGKPLYNQKDITKAKALLKESGYNGEEIIFLTNRDYDYMFKAVMATVDQLKKNLGLNIKVETLDWAGQRTKEKSTTGWHMTVSSFSVRFDGGDWSGNFHTKSQSRSYSNPMIDQLFDKASATTDPAQRKQLFTDFQKLMYDDAVVIRLGDLFGLEAVSSKVKGFKSWYTQRFWNTWKE